MNEYFGYAGDWWTYKIKCWDLDDTNNFKGTVCKFQTKFAPIFYGDKLKKKSRYI